MDSVLSLYFLAGLKRENVLEQVHTSLSNLQTSCIDILYLHGPDRNTPLEETLSACQQLHCGVSSAHKWLQEWYTIWHTSASTCCVHMFVIELANTNNVELTLTKVDMDFSAENKFKELGLSNFAAWEVVSDQFK